MRTYDAAEFHDKFGRDACEAVARRAGMSIGYFMHYVYGNRRPKQSRALLLQEASGGKLDAQKLIFAELRTEATAKSTSKRKAGGTKGR